MKIVKPKYYDNFICEAADCTFTCCQDWKITVDAATKKRWQKMPPPLGMKSRKKHLTDFVRTGDGGDEMILNKDGKCPFLDKDLLCHLVRTYGEGCLSHTCHTFPRETHEHDLRTEYALSAGCPAVLRLLWKEARFSVEEQDCDAQPAKKDAPETPEYLFEIRDWFMNFTQDESERIPTLLQVMFYFALDMLEKEEQAPLSEKDVNEYREKALIKEVFSIIQGMEINRLETFLEQNELLLDLAENYRKKKIYSDYLEPIAKHAEAYERLLAEHENAGEVAEDFAQELLEKYDGFIEQFQDYLPKLRLLLAEEIYSACLLPEGDLYSMVMKLQWIAMEYAVICQWSFLHFDLYKELTEESFLQLVAVIFRMTGYSEADIEEYLDNSFDSIIWEWGYFALITGK